MSGKRAGGRLEISLRAERKSLRHVITSINTIHSLLVGLIFDAARARPFDESQSSMLRQSEKIHSHTNAHGHGSEKVAGKREKSKPTLR